MPPVKIKFVVSFSSQDENFRAINLVNSDGFKKWLSNAKDKQGEISVTLQLEDECIISYIDIGTYWCANIEIKVGRSDWPQGREYETLAPTCIMMTPIDCNLGRNFSCTRMFSAKDFNDCVAARQWDRIRIICRQPLKKDVQYGLSFLKIKTANNLNTTSETPVTTALQKSVKSIQKHFFGRTKNSDSPVNEVKSKLLKMVGSSENGTEQESAMSRTAKLVLAASAGSRPREATPNKSAFYSETLAQKYGPEFQEEVKSFLGTLEIKEDELDKVTIADLRHKLERKKKRKLDKDERKMFAEMARNYICQLFGESDDDKKENSGKSVETNVDKERGNSWISRETNNKEKMFLSPKENTGGNDKTLLKEKVSSHLVKIQDISEQQNDLNLKNDFTNYKSSLTTEKKTDDIKDQLKQVRQNAHAVYRTTLEKRQASEKCTSSINSREDKHQTEVGSENSWKKNSGDDMYKNMSYLERKAFAMTNPYKANRYGASLTFGPDTSDHELTSPGQPYSPNTNNQWLSKVNPSRNDVMFTPSSRGKRKRGSSGTRRGKASKVSRKLDEDCDSVGEPEHKVSRRGRGRGRGRSAQEVRPTSFERCPQCQESFPSAQLSDHKMTCIKDRSVSPDVEEIGYSGPVCTDSLRSPEYMECPLCSEFYGSDVIQFHAAVCGDVGH